METPRGAITENELESKKRMLEQNCHEEPLATREMSKDVGCVPNEEAICDHSEEFDAFEEVEPGRYPILPSTQRAGPVFCFRC